MHSISLCTVHVNILHLDMSDPLRPIFHDAQGHALVEAPCGERVQAGLLRAQRHLAKHRGGARRQLVAVAQRALGLEQLAKPLEAGARRKLRRAQKPALHGVDERRQQKAPGLRIRFEHQAGQPRVVLHEVLKERRLGGGAVKVQARDNGAQRRHARLAAVHEMQRAVDEAVEDVGAAGARAREKQWRKHLAVEDVERCGHVFGR